MSLLQTAIVVVVGTLVNTGAAAAAGRRGSLSPSGVVAAALTGTVIFACGGLGFWIMLMLFFGSSTALGRAGRSRKRDFERLHEKGGRRDAFQVVANGGAAAIALLAYRITGAWWLTIAAAGSLAAANADTWASELGVLSRRPPRSIVTWRQLAPGVSGGVSLAGTAAGVAGAALIALWLLVVLHWTGTWPVYLSASVAGGVGNLTARLPGPPAGIGFATATQLALVVLAGGFAGTTLDSLLGATVQAQYRAPDGSTSERRAPDHDLSRGVRFVTNDVVNLAATIGAAAVSGLLAIVLVG